MNKTHMVSESYHLQNGLMFRLPDRLISQKESVNKYNQMTDT